MRGAIPVSEPIAILGMGCRFPGGASSPERFWELLSSGTDATCDVPTDRWDWRRFYDPDPDKPGKAYVKRGAFLRERVTDFDPLFFGISPREAVAIDPQQRLLMEVTYEALEDAGQRLEELRGSATGVFIGAFAMDMKLHHSSIYNRESLLSTTTTASSMTLLSNRLSYVFDWRGPSLSLDTACSSGLVAVHYACESLRQKECELAIAGAANVMLRPEYFMVMCKGRYLSPDGRCMTFDARGNGYARGEGAGVVLLKRLSDALRDRDPIYAVLRGSGVNHDGQTPGISFPSQHAQERLIEQVCCRAGVSPGDVYYVEAHGTGTRAGDPVEAKALHTVFSRGRGKNRKCVVGSVKSNIGHLEAAAGIAGLMKTALALKHRAIPSNLHFENPNPDIPFDQMCLRVPTRLEAWPEHTGAAYASVNSFGYGGTNAHALLEAAPSRGNDTRVNPGRTERPLLVPVSARSEQALENVAHLYQAFLTDACLTTNLDDLAYTLAFRRSHHDHRAAILAHRVQDVADGFRALAQGQPSPSVLRSAGSHEAGGCVFVYTGMGPQWWGMGRELLQREAVFRRVLEECDCIFARLAPWRLMDVFTCPQEDSQIARTQVAQPANFALQAALTALWASWGVKPDAVVGHSIGEVAAAYVSGALTLEQGVSVSYHRSRLQQTQAGRGGMLAVGLSEPAALELIRHSAAEISVAAVNSGSATTLAGDPEALQSLARLLERNDVFHRVMKVEVGYHSHHMDPLEGELLAALYHLTPRATRIPLYSSVTGKRVNGEELDANYWWRNVRETVRFADAMKSLIADGHNLHVEVGPHPVLAPSIKESLRDASVKGEVVASLHREAPELQQMLSALGTLYSAGTQINWAAVGPTEGEFIKLPAYPWQRATYWFESGRSRQDRLGSGGHVFLSEDKYSPSPSWEVEANNGFFPYLRDHVIEESIVFPGAAYVEAGLAMHRQILSQATCRLEEIVLHRMLVIDPKEVRVLRLQYDPGSKKYSVYSCAKTEGAVWELHATGRVLPGPSAGVARVSLDDLMASCPEELPADGFYTALQRSGFSYGPACRTLTELRLGLNQALGRIQVHPSLFDELPNAILHPTILDGALQLSTLMVDLETSRPWVPVGLERIEVHRSPGQSCWAHCRVIERGPDFLRTAIVLADEGGEVLVDFEALSRTLPAPLQQDPIASFAYELTWHLAAAEKVELAAGVPMGHWLIAGASGELQQDVLAELEVRGIPYTAATGSVDRERMREIGEALAGEVSIHVLYIAEQTEDFSFGTATTDCARLTALVQELSDWPVAGNVRLVVVTPGCHVVTATDTIVDVTASPLWGLGRVIRLEYPSLRCTLIDVASAAKAQVSVFVYHLLHGSQETEIAVRDGQIYVARIKPADVKEKAPTDPVQVSTTRPVALEIGVPGRLDTLTYRVSERRTPGPGEVEIQVHASALNFKDLLKVMGTISSAVIKDTYFGDAFGMECAGIVTRVGEGVSGIAPGDEVIASPSEGSFRSYVTAAKEYIYPKPHGLRMDEAPNLTGFLTAYYSLIELARLRPGEKVLIHNATGGVGLAAVQVAQWVGAEIFATAGTHEKRTYLRALGVPHVMDSRTLQFADKVNRATAGRGVDVVLNAMSGEALMKSFSLLAAYGRFVEIGKQDIAENSGLPMRTFNRNVSFASVDMDRMFLDRAPILDELVRAVCARFEQGDFRPLPVKAFPACEADQAFRYMAQAKHIGKVVLMMHDQEVTVRPAGRSTEPVRADGTYLITGGTRGFGLEIAKWLSIRGARHLVLVSRSGSLDPEARHALMVMRAKGIEVMVRAVNVADENQMAGLFAEIDKMPVLRGVIHGAMVLDDGLLAGLSEERFERVMAPKVLGAWLLHTRCAHRPLDFFVMLSSISSLLGNVGQGNYAAANAFLDHLAHYRRALGLPAMTVNWGPLAEVGVAARDRALEKMLDSAGIRSLPISQAVAAMEQLLRRSPTQIGIFDVDWQKWASLASHLSGLPLFQEVIAESAQSHAERALTPAMRFRCKLALLEVTDRHGYLQSIVAEALASVLQLPASQISADIHIAQLGLDSLMTVELTTLLQGEYGVEVSAVALMKGGTVSSLAAQLLAKLEPELAKAEMPDWLSDDALNSLFEEESARAAATRI